MSLIYKGKPLGVHGEDKVHDDIIFTPGCNRNTSEFDELPRGPGIHWTGGERGAEGVARVLKRRRLSVHFVCESDGTLVQLADLWTRCSHIGRPGNDRFWGVETTCRGFATDKDLQEAKKRGASLRERTQLDWDVDRDVYRDQIGGHYTNFAAFNPEQINSILWLSETLAGVFKFPRQIPYIEISEKDIKKMKSSVDVSKMVVEHEGKLCYPDLGRHPGRSRRSLAATHEGALGHFHIHKTKYDPGPQMMYAFWKEGWNPAGKKIDLE